MVEEVKPSFVVGKKGPPFDSSLAKEWGRQRGGGWKRMERHLLKHRS